MMNIFKKNLRTIAVSVMMSVSISMTAQWASWDPLWEKAVIDGNIKVNKEVKSQTTKLIEMAALQNTMALHFNAIKGWTGDYNSYLKTARGYAEALVASSNMAAEAVKTFRNLNDLRKAMTRNPEGIAATLSMTDLYIETVTEFIKTFRMLKFAVAGQEMEDEEVFATPVQSIPYEPGCVKVSVTLQNNSSQDVAFDGKICFILHGYMASEDYTGHKSFHGICDGGDYTIPAGGSRTYTVIFTKDDTPRDGLGLPFAGDGHTGSRTANNAYYIGNKGFTCENISESVTFQEGGSYNMVIPEGTEMWYSSSADGHSMLTGKERTEMLWSLVDRLDELNAKIRTLTLSVAYYRVRDIWAFYTRGIIPRDRADISGRCLERWNRVQDAIKILE